MRPARLRFTLASVLIAAASPAAAVNLVPNDSFEFITGCPTSFSQAYLAAPWDYPTTGTSDCFNVCVTGWPPFPVPDVPLSPFGYQPARTGVGYAGIIVRNNSLEYREYLQAPLASPLVANVTYQLAFYVNLADTSEASIDRLGAYFSVGPVGPIGNYAPLAFVPQIESPVNAFLSDTLNWMLVSGTFVAAGGEDHIVIGNFHDDATTNVQSTGNFWPGTYYYVEDVSVEAQPAQVDQACCLPDAQCTLLTPNECTALGGTPLGTGTDCDPNPCGPTASKVKSWGAVKAIYR